MKPLSMLNGHPDRCKVPGVEANTGPLGHGLPIAVGMALAAKMDRADWRTVVLTGDGELQEGSNWEAIMAASHFGLDNLTVVVDRNRLQQGDTTERTMTLEPLAERWRAFGWDVVDVDGHDIEALVRAFEAVPRSRGPADVRDSAGRSRAGECRSSRTGWNGTIACRPTPNWRRRVAELDGSPR